MFNQTPMMQNQAQMMPGMMPQQQMMPPQVPNPHFPPMMMPQQQMQQTMMTPQQQAMQAQVPIPSFPQIPALAGNPAMQQQLSQTAINAITMIATIAANTANVSPLHQHVSQMLCQNNFNNSKWQAWANNVYFITVGLALNNNAGIGHDGIAKVAYNMILMIEMERNPHLQQTTPVEIQQQLRAQANVKLELDNLVNQARAYINNGGQQQMMQHHQMTQTPPASSFTISQPAQVSNTGTYVSATGMLPQSTPEPVQFNNGTASKTNWRDGMQMIDLASSKAASEKHAAQQQAQYEELGGRNVIEPIGNKPIVQEWSSQNPGVVSINQLEPAGDVRGYMPANVKEVIFSIHEYKLPGFVYDESRPYDVIHNFGGVEIRPDFLCDWVATYDEDQPWPYLYNRETHMRFLVKWPDGTVKEKIVNINKEMDYLKHELDCNLRDKAMPYKGVVVPRETDFIIETTKEVKVVSAEDAFKQRIDESFKAEETIVTLEEPIIATSIEEAAYMAREKVRSDLELDGNEHVPAHIYTRRVNHVLQLSDTGIESVRELSKLSTFKEVAESLIRICGNGDISQSALRFINTRMTKAVNNLMAEQMRMQITISDFLEDGPKLYDYLSNKYGSDKAAEFRSWERPTIIRNLTVADRADSDDVVRNLDLVDFHRTMQLGGQSAELLGLSTKEVTALSSYTHEALREAIRVHTFDNAAKQDGVYNTRLFIITSDGCRFEMIPSGRKEMPILLAPRED